MIQPKNFVLFNQMSLSVRKRDQCTAISQISEFDYPGEIHLLI